MIYKLRKNNSTFGVLILINNNNGISFAIGIKAFWQSF